MNAWAIKGPDGKPKFVSFAETEELAWIDWINTCHLWNKIEKTDSGWKVVKGYTCVPVTVQESAQAGSGAHAWSLVSKYGLMRGIRYGKPTAEDLLIADADGDTIKYFYSSPPASADEGMVLVPREIIDRFPEINPSNYGHDDACNLNAWGVELVLAARKS